MLQTILLVTILLVLIGILTAVKSGFNEVIKGLMAISEELRTGARR